METYPRYLIPLGVLTQLPNPADHLKRYSGILNIMFGNTKYKFIIYGSNVQELRWILKNLVCVASVPWNVLKRLYKNNVVHQSGNYNCVILQEEGKTYSFKRDILVNHTEIIWTLVYVL